MVTGAATWTAGFRLLLSALGLLAALVLAHGGWRLLRRRRCAAAARLPADARVLRRADGVPARVFVDRDVPGGPLARGINRGRARLVLAEGRLVLATGHGRVLDLGPGASAAARCVGPKRLVLEGRHPSGAAAVRAELLVDDAEGWAVDLRRGLGLPPVRP